MKTLARRFDKEEIFRRLKEVRPDSSRRWGRMSSHQMVCHLRDSLRMAIGEKLVSGVVSPFPRPIVKWIALYLPLPWPAGLRTSPEIDAAMGGPRPVDFAADVATLEELVERMTTTPARFEWPSHPTFGRMSGAAWLRWGYLHIDHHLRQFGA